MRVVLIAPFALHPKGTVRARALPIARTLAAAGHTVSLLIPPVDNPAESGRRARDGGVAIENLRVGPDNLLGRLTIPVRLARAALARRPDLVWVWKPIGHGALAATYLRPFVRRIVQDADDWEGTGGWSTLNRRPRLDRWIVDVQERGWPRLADRVTVASAYLRDRFARIAGPHRVDYLPNCLTGDERLPDPAAVARRRDRLGLAPDTPVAAFAGYLPPDNDLDLALDAVALARRTLPGLRLLLIAAGPGLPAARARIDRLGLTEATLETGPVAESDLPDYLGLARLALGPYRDSIVNRARGSIKILHYLAAGCPVVATAVGENRAYLRDGCGGYLVAPDDPAAFAAAIVRLAGDPAHAADLGARGRVRALTEFRWADRVLPLIDRWQREAP